MRAFNAAGPRPVAELERPAVLNPLAFAASRGIVLDVRPPQAYANAHVPGSLAIPFRDSFAVWLGWLAAPDADLFLVSDGVPLDDVLQQAWLVGYERFGGVLDGGMETWVEAGLPVARMPMLSPADAAQRLAADAVLVDVREPSETARGTAAGALSIPLGELVDRSEALRKNQPVIVTCGVGERSTSAASILEREGFTSIANLAGGMDAWRSAGLPVD
jgi:rhodanese-related sulfurtransferase